MSLKGWNNLNTAYKRRSGTCSFMPEENFSAHNGGEE